MTLVATAAGPEDDESVIERVPCRCGQLAAIVVIDEGHSVTCLVRCGCGAFAPPAAQGKRA